MSRLSAVILSILAVLVLAASAIAGVYFSRAPGPVPVPKASTSPNVRTSPDVEHCYIEIQVPKTPTLWLETPREGSSNESCEALEQAAQSDVPPGSAVFLTGRPVPDVVVAQNGTLVVLALPGTVSPQLQHELETGLGRLLPPAPKN